MGARKLGKQLVEARPDVVGKLHLDDGLEAHGGHAYGASDDEGLLNRGVEDAVVAKLLGERGGLAKDASEAAPHVLAVEQGFGVGVEDFAHGKQGAVDHHGAFAAGGLAGSTLFGHGRRCQSVRVQITGRGVRSLQCALVVSLHAGTGGVNNGVQLGSFVTIGQQGGTQLREGVAGAGLVEVVAVPLHAHA